MPEDRALENSFPAACRPTPRSGKGRRQDRVAEDRWLAPRPPALDRSPAGCSKLWANDFVKERRRGDASFGHAGPQISCPDRPASKAPRPGWAPPPQKGEERLRDHGKLYRDPEHVPQPACRTARRGQGCTTGKARRWRPFRREKRESNPYWRSRDGPVPRTPRRCQDARCHLCPSRCRRDTAGWPESTATAAGRRRSRPLLRPMIRVGTAAQHPAGGG